MAVFSYTATEVDASVTTGTIVADTPRQARDQLRGRGLTIHQIVEQVGSAKSRLADGKTGALSPLLAVVDHLANLPKKLGSGKKRIFVVDFVRELSTLLGVGTPLLEAIDLLVKQHPKAFKPLLLKLRDRVASGVSLADAMHEQSVVNGGVFDEVTISMTEVGENAGTLDTVLAEVADFKERSAQLKGKISSALIYPAIVLTVGLGVSIFLMTYVVPGLLHSLIRAGRRLPTVTKLVKGVSDMLVHDWWLLLLIALGLFALGAAVLSTTAGRRIWDRFLLRVPGLGDLIRKQAIVRIAFVIATLMRSGIAFEKAIAIAQRSTWNVILREALHRCQEAVTAGRDIGAALEHTRAFPITVVQVFSLGQQSGRLEQMLERLATDYDRQVATAANRFAAMIEPILILLLASIVGTIAFATMLPILEMGNAL